MSKKKKSLIEQPDNNRFVKRRRAAYNAGGKRGAQILEALHFDPIGEMVSQYEKLQEELEIQEKWRDGEIVKLYASGRVMPYNAEVHQKIYDQLQKITNDLMRYAYARVPEGNDAEAKPVQPLVINLSEDIATYKKNVEKEEKDGD